MEFASLALAGAEFVETVTPELLDGFESLLAGVEGVSEVLGEFVVGFGLAWTAKLDGGLPECVLHSVLGIKF